MPFFFKKKKIKTGDMSSATLKIFKNKTKTRLAGLGLKAHPHASFGPLLLYMKYKFKRKKINLV